MLRILLIDDNPDDRVLAIRTLSREFKQLQIEEIAEPKGFNESLKLNHFDLVITDYQLLWSDGITVLRTLKQYYPECPVIMFTNSGSQEVAVEAMKAGLDDYVIKAPQHYIRLGAAARLALERTQERQRAARLEIRLQSLLNRLDLGIFRSSLEGNLLEANAAFLNLVGFKNLTEAQSYNLHDLFLHPQERSQLLERLQQEKQLSAQEAQLRRVDGQLIWVAWNKTLTTIDKETFIDGLVEDISERKQLEESLKQNAEELAEANRLKDDFLATLSHELRTPVNSILGWSKLLRTRQIDQNVTVRALEAIERNAKLQTQLIEDILDVSRIIGGKMRLEVYPVNLIGIINAALESLHPAADAKSIKIKAILESNIGIVLGDPNRLQQVCWNLLSNAIKFTPQEGRIEVRLERVNSYAQIKFTDTGIGIRPEFLPYVFDRFRQADSSITRSYSGLGLGLAIVRHLVEMHGGTVEAESPGIGQGSTFTVKIPVNKDAQLPSANDNWEVDSSQNSNQELLLAGVEILIVDDEADMRDLLTFILTQYGATVTAAKSAAEAFSAIQKSPPNMLISDIGMPEENGYSLIRKVKAWQAEQGKEFPAIALTAYSRGEDRQQAILAGFQMHVSKPVDPEELITVVLHVLHSY